MSKYTSQPKRVERPAAEISEKFADLSSLQSMVDQLPDESKSKLGNIEFGRDTITLQTAQVGNVTFKVTDLTPHRVTFQAIGIPMPMELIVHIQEVTPESSDVSVEIDVTIPMMLRPMVAPHLQKAVDMLGGLIANVASR